MSHKPLLIAVEGLDGCGKSTLARNLAVALGAGALTICYQAGIG